MKKDKIFCDFGNVDNKECGIDKCGTKVPPPNFSGAKVPPPRKYTHLPHIDLEGYYQFITFRTYDSVDDFIKRTKELKIPEKQKQHEIDKHLDKSTKGAYLIDDVLDYLYDFLLKKDKEIYELVAFCIMNNHIHMLIKPLKNLSYIMQILKGTTAKKINEILNKSGRFWADDYFDKVIRDEKHFMVVYEYIKNNPLEIEKKCGAEAPPPKNEVPPPRFYGIFE